MNRDDQNNQLAVSGINSAKVEIDHMKLVGGTSVFIAGDSVPKIQRTNTGTKTVVAKLPGGYITQHRMS